MWDVWDVGCLGCGMLGMWDVQDMRYSECGMFAGLWDVDLKNDEFQQMNLLRRGSKKKKVLEENSINTKLNSLRSSKLPKLTEKYNNLLKLCELCIIPDDDHE